MCLMQTRTKTDPHAREGGEENTMIGAIAGDVIGSVYEHGRIKRKDFPRVRGSLDEYLGSITIKFVARYGGVGTRTQAGQGVQ